VKQAIFAKNPGKTATFETDARRRRRRAYCAGGKRHSEGGRLNALKNTDSKPFLDFSQATWRLPWGLGDGNVRVDSPVLQTATSGPKAAKSR